MAKVQYDDTELLGIQIDIKDLRDCYKWDILDDATLRCYNVLNSIAKCSELSSFHLDNVATNLKNNSEAFYPKLDDAYNNVKTVRRILKESNEVSKDTFDIFTDSLKLSSSSSTVPRINSAYDYIDYLKSKGDTKKAAEVAKLVKNGGKSSSDSKTGNNKKTENGTNSPVTNGNNYYDNTNAYPTSNGTSSPVVQPQNTDPEQTTPKETIPDDGLIEIEPLTKPDTKPEIQPETRPKPQVDTEPTIQEPKKEPTTTIPETPEDRTVIPPKPPEVIVDKPDETYAPDPVVEQTSDVGSDISGDTGTGYTVNTYSYTRPQSEATATVPGTESSAQSSVTTTQESASVVGATKDLFKKKNTDTTTKTLPKSSSTTKTSTNSSSSSFNPVPLAIGLGAAVAGGVGIKAYKDHKENSGFDDENEDSLTNGNRFWTDDDPNVINSEQSDFSDTSLFDEPVLAPSYEAVSNGNDTWSMDEQEGTVENQTFDLLGDN